MTSSRHFLHLTCCFESPLMLFHKVNPNDEKKITSNALVREYIYSANSLQFILTETD